MKKNAVLALVLSLALCMGSVSSVFANTYDGVSEDKAEEVTYTFTKDVMNGGYNLIDTNELATKIDKKDKMVIIDTMPAGSYTTQNGHVPGAVNVEVGSGTKGDAYKWKDGQKEALIKAIPTVNKTTWKKVTKATWSKLPKAQRKTAKVNKKTVYYKKVVTVVPDKNATVIVYCGFIGCARSHIAAKYLVENGFKNVYRYGGGILAWKDAGMSVEK